MTENSENLEYRCSRSLRADKNHSRVESPEFKIFRYSLSLGDFSESTSLKDYLGKIDQLELALKQLREDVSDGYMPKNKPAYYRDSDRVSDNDLMKILDKDRGFLEALKMPFLVGYRKLKGNLNGLARRKEKNLEEQF